MTRVRVVRVHCPVSGVGLARLQAGDGAAIADEPALAAIVALIRDDAVLGAIGTYRGVFELGFGLESFIPGTDARPTTGHAGQVAVVPSVVVKSYAPIDADLTPILTAIAAAHPWEIPVIEVGEAVLAGA